MALASSRSKDYLHGIWNLIPTSPGFSELCVRYRAKVEAGAQPGLFSHIKMESPEAYEQVSSPDEIFCSSHLLGGQHLVYLIHLPPPAGMTEAYFVALISNPTPKYLTLEKSSSMDGGEITAFCQWNSQGTHLYMNSGCEPKPEEFLKLLCRHLDVPETIEEPTQ